MAKQKKRGFFSWLGFGEKEQEQEQKTEEQQVVEEQRQADTPVETAADVEAESPAHSKEETDHFAQEVVEVTEQVQESEKPQLVEPEPPAVADEPQPEVEPLAVAVREELPLPEEVNAEEISPEEWQAEAETVEIVDAVEEEAQNVPPLSDEEREAQALAAEAAEEAVLVVPVAEENAPVEEIAQEQEKPTKEGFFARLKRSLLKTKENLGSGFISLFRGKKIDDDLFEELEEQLLIADVGVETTRKIITNLTEGASRKQLRDAEALYGLLKDEMGEILAKVDEPLNVEGKTPFVILMVGVNGVGKTTTIGKLARQFEQQGKSVMLAAGDTFRAAAVEQLQVWGQRN
ncbi:signal recognition particle receptor subunit alpha, partial [Salmonella enterica]|nr:signal recognition particle receptor subunit alpha [Salmonella enterica]